MKASITARSAPCIAFSLRTAKFLSGVGNFVIRPTPNRNCWPEAPNQVWSWDITKLKGPVKWTYFYLYVILDIFSRRVVGWCIADAENAALFKELCSAKPS